MPFSLSVYHLIITYPYPKFVGLPNSKFVWLLNSKYVRLLISCREILIIGFNPVVREGLQTILDIDEAIEVIRAFPVGNGTLLHIKRTNNQRRSVDLV